MGLVTHNRAGHEYSWPPSFLLIFWWGGGLRPVKIISFILSRVIHKVGWKREIPDKNHLTTRKQNLSCLTWPELGSNLQEWDDERFRTLKISVLNHSATVATKLLTLVLAYISVVIFGQTSLVKQWRPRSDSSWRSQIPVWRSSLIRIYTVCHSVCMFWTH